MTALAYYNEIDPKAAAWLRELIKRGLIAPGDVDERSIEDVAPIDVAPYRQCHFFAGVGVWSYALRQAGWPDDRAVWTGSAPCQSFSSAGKRGGFDDERHLWPAWFWLISQCRPGVIFGEQVASRDGLTWLDLVSADLEGAGYAVGAADLCAAGFGAPHIRQRLFFVAHAEHNGRRANEPGGGTHRRVVDGRYSQVDGLAIDLLADAAGDGSTGDAGVLGRVQGEGGHEGHVAEHGGADDRLEHACGDERGKRRTGEEAGDRAVELAGSIAIGDLDATRRALETACNGYWRGADWVWCNDPDGPRWRPTEPGSFPLAHRPAARMVRLRGYGNAIVAPVATEFIRAYLDAVE